MPLVLGKGVTRPSQCLWISTCSGVAAVPPAGHANVLSGWFRVQCTHMASSTIVLHIVLMWDAVLLCCMLTQAYPGHRDVVTGLAFREGTHTLISSSYDRTLKLWSLDDSMYVDTLYGHQAEVRQPVQPSPS